MSVHMSGNSVRDRGKQPLVWYASYGSNMDARRFACYIQGGVPLGGTRDHIGCDDKSMPVAETGMEIPYSLYFAGESAVWTGGVAFVRGIAGEQKTKSKAYLITKAQFEQVVAQESRRDYIPPMDITLLRTQGQLIVEDGNSNYDQVLYCGEYQGYPVLTCTSPHLKQPYTKPAHTYIKMITAALWHTHDLTANEIFAYLCTKPGISGNYSEAELSEVIVDSLPSGLHYAVKP